MPLSGLLLNPTRNGFFGLCFFVFLSGLFGGLQSYTFKGFVDAANSYALSSDGSTQAVFLWVLAYPVLLLLAAGAIRVNGFMMNFLTVYARTRAVKILFEYLSLHSLAYFSDRFSGALSEKVATISGNVSRLIDQFIWSILGLLSTFVVTSVIIFSADKTLAAFFTSGFFILIPINIWFTRKQLYL